MIIFRLNTKSITKNSTRNTHVYYPSMKSRDSISPLNQNRGALQKTQNFNSSRNFLKTRPNGFIAAQKKINERRSALPVKEAYLNLAKFRHQIDSIGGDIDTSPCSSTHINRHTLKSHKMFDQSIKENVAVQHSHLKTTNKSIKYEPTKYKVNNSPRRKKIVSTCSV